MPLNSPINDLTELGERFQTWKQLYPHRYVPKQFWNDALKLITKYGLNDVAKSISVPAHYLRLKQQHPPTIAPEIQFADIEPDLSRDSSHINMHIHNRRGLTVDISLQGSVGQVFPLIFSLLKEETACSK